MGSRDYSAVGLHGLLPEVGEHVGEHELPGAQASAVVARGIRGQSQKLWCVGLIVPHAVESSWIRDQTRISVLAGGFFTTEPPGGSNRGFKK